MTECIFCKIAKGDIPADKVLETDDVLAIRDVAPQAPVHILVIPKQHLSNIKGFSPENGQLLTNVINMINKVAKETNIENGFRVVTNTGATAGQSVDHVHFHVLGGRQMDWPPG